MNKITVGTKVQYNNKFIESLGNCYEAHELAAQVGLVTEIKVNPERAVIIWDTGQRKSALVSKLRVSLMQYKAPSETWEIDQETDERKVITPAL